MFSHHDYDTTISKYAMEMAIGWFRILEYYPLISDQCYSIVSSIGATLSKSGAESIKTAQDRSVAQRRSKVLSI